MKVGYVRFSSQGQNTAHQEVLMQELGVNESSSIIRAAKILRKSLSINLVLMVVSSN